MEEKIKVKNQTLHKYLFTVTTFSKLLAMALFILLPFIGFYLGIQYQQKINISPQLNTEKNKASALTSAQNSNWNTYKNSKYGFQFNYPKTDIVGSKEFKHTGDCGKDIRNEVIKLNDSYWENSTPLYSFYEEMTFDNFFGLNIIDWKKSINDFINESDSENIFKISPITNSNADEAIKVGQINMEAFNKWQEKHNTYGSPMLGYYDAIYKKGNKLFGMHGFQNLGSNGCANTNNELRINNYFFKFTN